MGGWRIHAGVLLGLAVAVGIGPFTDAPAQFAAPPHGPLLSDVDGALREIVIQYVPAGASIVETVYREFLSQLPADVRVLVVCPDEAAFADFRTRVRDVPPALVPVYARHAMTCWSRDRWLAFAPSLTGARHVLMAPRVEDGEEVWPRRAGDKKIGADLAGAAPETTAFWRSPLAFDGGDFVADRDTVFVSPRVARRNVGTTIASVAALREHLADLFQRPVVLLEEAPDHHAGMYLMLAGHGRAVVGDPGAARRLLRAAGVEPPIEADWSDATQARFDAVADRALAAGYAVHRVPVVPGMDGRTYVTYLNAVLDERPGGRVVYLPRFRGAEVLDAAAAAVWRDLGYRVHSVDCTAAYVHFGSLRCLVNVLRRGP